MGAWTFVEPYLEWVLAQVGGKAKRAHYAGRPASASPATGLHELFIALDRAASQTAAVANVNAAGWSDSDTFFTAFAGAARSLEEATVGGPAALEQATHSLPFETPFLEKSTEFMRLLRPSAHTLRTVAQPLGHAFAEGAVNLHAATALNSRLASSSQALQSFGQNPVVTLGLEDFTQTLQLGTPVLAGLAPEQAYCNYLTLTFRNVASLLSENIGIGTLARAAIVLSPNGPNNEGYPSSAPANGPSVDKTAAVGSKPGTPINDDHVHANPYPNVAGPGQPKVCEAGNEKYEEGKTVIGNLPAASVESKRELTSRSEGLFGEKYPAATQRDLGLTQPVKGKGK